MRRADGEAGYTLAEMLVALLAVGFVVSGLAIAAETINLNQSAARRTLDQTKLRIGAQAALAALLADRGPFLSTDSDAFRGLASHFSFDCGGPKSCTADLADDGRASTLTVTGAHGPSHVDLGSVSRARFAYVGESGPAGVWPTGQAPPERLRAIELVVNEGGDAEPMATVWLWRDEPPGCVFDPINKSCSEPKP